VRKDGSVYFYKVLPKVWKCPEEGCAFSTKQTINWMSSKHRHIKLWHGQKAGKLRLHNSGSKKPNAPENNRHHEDVSLEKAEPGFHWQCPLCDLGIRKPPPGRGDGTHRAARRRHLKEARRGPTRTGLSRDTTRRARTGAAASPRPRTSASARSPGRTGKLRSG